LQFTQFFPGGDEGIYELQRGQDSISRRAVIKEDDMARLFSAKIIASSAHLFHHIAVAYSCHLRLKPELLNPPVKAEVAHHRGDDCPLLQPAFLVQRLSADSQNIVPVYFLTVL